MGRAALHPALHLLLAPHGLTWLVARRQALRRRGHRIVRERPYELTSVFGVGFHVADRSPARRACSGLRARARAGVVHALAEAERNGSTCLPVGVLAAAADELLGAALDAQLLAGMAERGDLVMEPGTGEVLWAYRPRRPRSRRSWPSGWRARPRARPTEGPRGGGRRCRPGARTGRRRGGGDDLAAVDRDGRPGYRQDRDDPDDLQRGGRAGFDVLLVAPTGRAARRIAESTDRRLDRPCGARLGPGRGTDTRRARHADLLMVDETSMANLELLVTLLRAVGPRTHVVLVGDADQLAPVGAGKPFAELVEAGAVPVTELTHIFRQAAGSMIVRGAHAVRQGGAPSFAAEEGLTRDLFLVERADPAQALEEVVSLVCERLPEHYGVDPVADIQVFAPVYRGALGIDVLNERLRAVLNPDGRPVLAGASGPGTS